MTVPNELISQFLESACPDHHVRGGPDHVRARHTALRLLARYPEIARANLYTAIVCGDVAAVEETLAERPELASMRSSQPGPLRAGNGSTGDLFKDLGPKGWEPLLYLCFARLPIAAVSNNAVAIARALLDNGADPNVYFMAGDSRYTPLVGVLGEGEEDRPSHLQRDALARLLLERGAEPYDSQVIYNIHFRGDVLWFLELAYDRAVRLGRGADWDDPDWSMLNMGAYGSGARWTLEAAIKRNDARLATWCLTHGANPNAAPARDRRFSRRSLYGQAIRDGRTAIAELLAGHGAIETRASLTDMDEFVGAALRLDAKAIHAHLARHPEYLRAHEPLFAAAAGDRVDAAAFLLDLGMSPNVESSQKERPLHIASYNNAVHVATLLIARGAEIDPVAASWGNTPLGGAIYHQHAAMIELLAAHSRDIWELPYTGNIDRLRSLLNEHPDLAKTASGGQTLLMWLPPDDEQRALEIAQLLLAHGADPSPRNADGMTAADRAERLAMFDLAALLREGQ